MSVIQNLKTKKKRRPRAKQPVQLARPIVLLVKVGILLAVIAGVALTWLALNRRTAEEYMYYRDRLMEVEQQEQALKDSIAALEKRNEALNNDSFEIERIAREHHLMMRPTERVILFTPRDD